MGRGIVLRSGEAAAILCAGTLMPEVLTAADILSKGGISCRVVSMHTVKPLDTDLVSDALTRCGLTVTVEEHGLIGGLGTAVAEFKADAGLGGRLLRLGIPDAFVCRSGNQTNARACLGLDAASLAERISRALKGL